MTLADVLNFLIPDSGVSTLAGLVILVLTITCGVMAWRARRVLAGPAPEGSEDSAHGLVDCEAELTTAGMRFAEALPSVIVMVGLIFTFLGLGVAIHKAADPAAMQTPSGLLGILTPLGYKFQTSVWAIFASLATRGLVSRWISTPRAQAASELSRAVMARGRLHYEQVLRDRFQFLVESWQTTLQEQSSQQKEGLDRVIGALAPVSGLQAVAETLRGVAEGQKRAGEQLNGSTLALDRTVRQLASDQVDAHRRLSDAVSNMGNGVNTVLTNVGTELQTAVARTRGVVETLNGSLDTHLTSLKTQLAEMRRDNRSIMDEWKDTFRESAETQGRFLDKALNDFGEKLSESLDKISGDLGAAAGGIRSAVEASQSSLNGIIGEVGQAIKGMTVEVERLQEVSKIASDRNAEIKRHMAELASHLANVAESAARLRSKAIENNTERSAALLQEHKGLIEQILGATLATADRVKPLSTELTALNTSASEAGRRRDEIGETLRRLGDALSTLQDAVAALPKHDVRRLSEETTSILQVLQEDLSRVAGAVPAISMAIDAISPPGAERSIHTMQTDLLREVRALSSAAPIVEPIKETSDAIGEHLVQIQGRVEDSVGVLRQLVDALRDRTAPPTANVAVAGEPMAADGGGA